MGVLVLTGFGREEPLAGYAQDIADQFHDLSDLLAEVGERILLPAFARNYTRSGLKSRSSALFKSVSARGAKGNIFEVCATGITVGMDDGAIPYAKWAFDGRGPVRAKNAKALRFDPGNGKPIFRKSVGPSQPHAVIYLTDEDYEAFADAVTAGLIARGATPLPK